MLFARFPCEGCLTNSVIQRVNPRWKSYYANHGYWIVGLPVISRNSRWIGTGANRDDKIAPFLPPEVRDLHEIKYVIPQPLVGTVIGPYCHICQYKTAINVKVMIIWFCKVINVDRIKVNKTTFTSEQKNFLFSLPIIEDTWWRRGNVTKALFWEEYYCT